MATRVATGLGHDAKIAPLKAAQPTRDDLENSPPLSILAKGPPPLEGRKIGCVVSDGADGASIKALDEAITAAGAQMKIIAPRVGGVTLKGGKALAADFQLAGGPSVLFDAVVLILSEEGAAAMCEEAAAVAFVHDAFQHCKVIGHSEAAQPLLDKAGVKPDAGVVAVDDKAGDAFVKTLAAGRIWDREPKVKTVF